MSSNQSPTGGAAHSGDRPPLDNIQQKGKFKKVKSLNDAFEKEDGGRARCKFCDKIITSHSHDAIMKHNDTCAEIPEVIRNRIRLENDSKYPQTKMSDLCPLSLTFTKFLAATRTPLRVVDDPYFRYWVEALVASGGWNVPSRQELSKSYVPWLADDVKKSIAQRLESEPDHSVSVEFDMWEELCGRSLLAVLITFGDGTSHLVDYADVSPFEKTSSLIAREIKEMIKDIPPNKINAFVSDAASNCLKAREELTKDPKYMKAIHYGCKAHWLNRIGVAMCKKDCFQELETWVNSVYQQVYSKKQVAGKLKQLGVKKIPKAIEVRWYSRTNMFEAVFRSGRVILNTMRDLISEPELTDDIKKLGDEEHMCQLGRAISILRPLNESIAVAERSRGSLGELTHAVLEYGKYLQESNWNSRFVIAGIESFLSYFDKLRTTKEHRLVLAAYALDRRYSLNYLTKFAMQEISPYLSYIAKLSGFEEKVAKETLLDEFVEYCRLLGPYKEPPDTSESAYEYWLRQNKSTVALRIVALRISSMKSSSGNIERCFSIMKGVQNSKKTRLSDETFANLTQILIACSQVGPDGKRRSKEKKGAVVAPQPRQASSQTTVSAFSPTGSTPASQATAFDDSSDSEDGSLYEEIPSPHTFSNEDVTLFSSTDLIDKWDEFKKLIDFKLVHSSGEDPIDGSSGIYTIDDNDIMQRFERKLSSLRVDEE